MNSYLSLPFSFLKFWFVEAPVGIYDFFTSLNHAFFQMFGLPLFIKTFFEPLKNEYRPGLIGFSRAMGVIVKSFIIIADLVIFIPLLAIEMVIFVGFITFPIITIITLFL